VRHRRGQPSGIRRGAAALALAFLALVPAPLLAAGQPTEQDVKAAFLYHFAQYVEWPETAFTSATSPFVMGVVGDGGFLAAISSAVADKSVAGHRIVVKSVSAPAQTRDCHMVFITSSETSRVPAMLGGMDATPVLAVGDAAGFAGAGGAIGFVIADGKVGFQINPTAVRRAGLKISSKLLRLAEIVDED
jgi:hypothetical protein